MDLSQLILPGLVAVGERLESKARVIERIASLAKTSPVLGDRTAADIVAALTEREEVGTTGFGDGIAIPHCRLEGIDDFVIGLLTVPEGVDFKSTDGKPVNIVAFIIGPESDPTRHLKLLSALSLTLSTEETRRALRNADSPAAAIRALGSGSSVSRVPEKISAKRLFQVIVQDEALFITLLEVLEGTEDAHISVVEGRNTGEYLARVPLFASLLSDSPQAFNRIVLAVVPAALANDTVRRMELVTGPLDERADVLVVVQDVHFCAGSLSF